ncbi:beta-glucosidase [[Clostridium] polysaccharolyticum]|uniref:Beta-glucosidase n=1 Tax=[Clostridium] polysaccharolyticum TaxID=29364 RepID=A0A1I0EP95_9FIRM|nr:glycoside hydrolase family 3 C-terminal domain-containing protein [[Clostridium] polysaccharolyticum]SET46569.1 beta-glucosidase [[Clostridium] polysaccharolyticum]
METETWIQDIVKQMTLDEKIAMIHGAGLFRTGSVERLGIPSLVMTDGPIGVRAEFEDKRWIPNGMTSDYASYFPSGSALAATFNTELARLNGKVLGEEARGRGKDVLLAPSINIKRTPLCGRNFEYMSEDPKVIEEMCVPFIQGIQENDVAACVKHLAANSQENDRMAVDTIVDERTLNELYFKGFYAAVKEGNSYCLMGAYNKLNGEYCCTSRQLLNQVVREKWNYDGTIISDWGGVHGTVEAAESSLDIEMDIHSDFDEHYMANPLKEKIENGELSEGLVDKKVSNILRLMKRLNMIGEDKGKRKSGTYSTVEHHQAALDIARESIVLLKNEDSRLPIRKEGLRRIAVIGENGIRIHSNKGGSSELKALYETPPLLGIKKILGGNVTVEYAKGYEVADNLKAVYEDEESWQASSTQEVDISKIRVKTDNKERERLLKEAVELAKTVDEVIFIGGLNHAYDLEGIDRLNMVLPYGQDRVIEEVLKVNPNTVVVMCAGSPVEMPWQDKAKAIVFQYYAGMEGGTALAEILFGDTNPSGKLPETFPYHATDCLPVQLGEMGKPGKVTFKEKLKVGYRQYDTDKTEVAFCFGHGLSYTQFQYSDLKAYVSPSKEEICVKVSFTVTNTGDRAGKEIAQLYVSDVESSEWRPVHELKAFRKIYLKPKEQKQVEIKLGKDAFSYYAQKQKQFIIEEGSFVIEVGASSRDIRERATITLGAF